MAELTKLIKISEQNKEILEDRKKRNGMTSLNSVIDDLLNKADAYEMIQDREKKISRLKKKQRK